MLAVVKVMVRVFLIISVFYFFLSLFDWTNLLMAVFALTLGCFLEVFRQLVLWISEEDDR